MIGIELTQAGGALRSFRSGSGLEPAAVRTVADEVVCVAKKMRADGGADFSTLYFDGTAIPPEPGELFVFWFVHTKVLCDKFPVGDVRREYLEQIVDECRRAWGMKR